ncbi:MAG: beta-phosphoglucomutase [Phycisphaeraceae bacterium]|nr:beta-phosphoglucomutase [Phycisphaerales bacterium]QOJ18806.1 MAG: beta-phosphoglucomutase [Phycisphaeraceae bacterium]
MIRGVIFDLDGVLVHTDELHYQSWKRIADEEGVPFDRTINDRLRGVDRMTSLAILLERAGRPYDDVERRRLAERKNDLYRQALATLTPQDAAPGAHELLRDLRARGVKTAVASSSRNAPLLLERLNLRPLLDAVADGNDAAAPKPAPDLFLLAARRSAAAPDDCVVVEDAESGVAGALAAGMRVIGIGPAGRDPRAHRRAADLASLRVEDVVTWPDART